MTDAELRALGCVPVTDPAEIEAIQRDGLDDPIGGFLDGQWCAYAWSLERWRKGRAAVVKSEGLTRRKQ